MEQALAVPEHEHPLKLIDLLLQYEEEEEEEEEESGDHPIIKKEESFHGVPCKRCGEEIHMYHRYYYTCMNMIDSSSSSSSSSCGFSVHKFCGELSTRLDHPFHPHTLQLQLQVSKLPQGRGACYICKMEPLADHRYLAGGIYICPVEERCVEFFIDVKCAVEVGKNVIHHPSHPQHLLTRAIPRPILCYCMACGEDHNKGIFYQCTICTGFTIHNQCVFLPKSLLIQHTTNNAYYHTHPLTLSYSFPQKDQQALHFPECRVCRGIFSDDMLWIYKCDKCMYYAHLDCARSLLSWLSWRLRLLKSRFGLYSDFSSVDTPDVVYVPFPDETYSIAKHIYITAKHLFLQESGSDDDHHKVENHLTHMSHQHPLILVDDHTQTSSSPSPSSSNAIINSWLFKCHNPVTKTQLLCNACLRPIMATHMPFYGCANEDEPHCNFSLHEWCTRLPPRVGDHPGHSKLYARYHPLLLVYSNSLFNSHFFGVFYCAACCLPCNGFAYACVECGYYVDVNCGLISRESIKHEAHPNHNLTLYDKQITFCDICRQGHNGSPLALACHGGCEFQMHPECALLIPKTIRHKYDKKHPLHLSYLPIENHKSEYFCEICEEDLNPHLPFYHCKDCALSIHTSCAPLILQCETQTHERYPSKSIYYFVNIKFGGILHNTNAHPHSLSFAQGTVLDGECQECSLSLQYEMIFKCLECKFAIHFDCCKRLNKQL